MHKAIEKNRSLQQISVQFIGIILPKNFKTTPEPITYRGPWQREDDMEHITNYCGRNMAMLYNIVDHCGIYRDEQKFDVFRIFDIMHPVLECVTDPYGDGILMLECFIS